MRRPILTLLLICSVIASAQDPDTTPDDTFRKMYENNDTYRASLREFDRRLWEEEGRIAWSMDHTLRIELSENVFLKTMAIVNINADATRTGILGVEKILFGLEIRFQGF